MIPPREQWAAMIDVTNACPGRCSNCTRLTAHAKRPYFMTPADFRTACESLRDFPLLPPADHRRRLVGMIGGEPLMHPQFSELCRIMREVVPRRSHRGLWTGLDYRNHIYAEAVDSLVGKQPTATVHRVPLGAAGYLNQNLHRRPSWHQPVLVAIEEVIPDKHRMWRMIDDCPLQKQWSSTITPKGFFFCEVAGALDMIFQGPGGLPVTPDCWRHDVDAYREQAERWCPKCSFALPLFARRDDEEVDDVSAGNLRRLYQVGSPGVRAGRCRLYDPAKYRPPDRWRPLAYGRTEP